MLKTLFLAVFALTLTGPITHAAAQQTFVVVPDAPGGTGGGGGGFGGSAVTNSNLNVRSGPGTSYPVLDVLIRGDGVRINTCNNGWCWINHNGPSGWVSEAHLTRTGGNLVARPLREACFFEQPHFRGRSFCASPGDNDRNLGTWNNRISSIRIRGFTTVQVCAGRNFSDCDAFSVDIATLPRWLNRNVSSFRVH